MKLLIAPAALATVLHASTGATSERSAAEGSPPSTNTPAKSTPASTSITPAPPLERGARPRKVPRVWPPVPEEATEARFPRAELSTSSLFALGLLPAPALGMAPYASYRWPTLSVAIEARALFTLDNAWVVNGLRSRAELVMAVPSACGYGGRWFACGSLGIGELHAATDGDVPVETVRPWLVAIGARAGFDLVFLSRLALRTSLEANLVIGKPEVWINHVRQWEASSLGFTLSAGLVFPVGSSFL
ncbi:hypothetical protein [Chondromyces apiculatus]|uniref:Uncharacterized protein n=1 Tax=Chondromyces apiculatus DSM 436 TaxID=1192034 RepID=A0A017TDZ9_9BACT|nr:hypothetical protein [Chondromyces apiculatus]EYF07025.1 Hypothetical protein CAP_1284 [Chondromyces apiculatus DSM 436]